MFKFFNFFKNQDTNKQTIANDDDDILARISYIIKKNNDGGLIDVELNDYDDESVAALCKLLNILGNDVFFVDTISMIRSSLIQDNREDLLIKILASVGNNIKQKLLNKHSSEKLDEPCIKPSDML